MNIRGVNAVPDTQNDSFVKSADTVNAVNAAGMSFYGLEDMISLITQN